MAVDRPISRGEQLLGRQLPAHLLRRARCPDVLDHESPGGRRPYPHQAQSGAGGAHGCDGYGKDPVTARAAEVIAVQPHRRLHRDLPSRALFLAERAAGQLPVYPVAGMATREPLRTREIEGHGRREAKTPRTRNRYVLKYHDSNIRISDPQVKFAMREATDTIMFSQGIMGTGEVMEQEIDLQCLPKIACSSMAISLLLIAPAIRLSRTARKKAGRR